MDATSFELNVSLPGDAKFAATLRDLAVHAARYAGCRGADADAFGQAVEGVVLVCIDGIPAGSHVPIVVRRGNGPVEVLIECERPRGTIPAAGDHISVGWTREDGRSTCRVARAMPRDL